MSDEQSRYICPLCGDGFDEGVDACGSCPLSGNCEAVCCPRCGYQLVTGSRIVDALRRLRARLTPWRSRGRNGDKLDREKETAS